MIRIELPTPEEPPAVRRRKQQLATAMKHAQDGFLLLTNPAAVQAVGAALPEAA